MRKQHLPMQRLMSHETLVGLASEMRFPDISGLYAAVGEGHVSAANVVQKLVDSAAARPARKRTLPSR